MEWYVALILGFFFALGCSVLAEGLKHFGEGPMVARLKTERQQLRKALQESTEKTPRIPRRN